MADGTPSGSRRHTSGFDVVGQSSDPTPGDVNEIGRLEARYREIGDNANTALELTKKGGEISQGKGKTMDSLNKAIGNLPDKLQRTVDSYEAAADAYKGYASVLKQAQDQLDQAMDQALEVSSAANATVDALPDNATDDQKAQNKQQQDAKNAAQDKLSAAKRMAADAKALRDGAASTYAQQVEDAAGKAIPERNIFQKIADFFKKFPFVQILLAALVAIVAVLVPVAGFLLGGALFAFNQIVAIGSGNFKLGDFLAGLVALVPIGSAIGAVGRGVVAGATKLGGAVGGIAGKVSVGVNRISGSITRVGDQLKNQKTVQGIINNSIGKGVVTTGGKFVEGAVTETGIKAANHEQITPEGILAGAAGGAVLAGGIAGVKAAGGLGNIIKGKGSLTTVKDPDPVPPVATPNPPAAGSGSQGIFAGAGDRAKESLTHLAPEVATIGTKVGVAAASGEDPLDALNSEGANAIPKAGFHGTKAVGGKLDGLFQGPTGTGHGAGSGHGSTTGHTGSDTAATPSSPTTGGPTASGPGSPTSPTGHTATDPADVPLPPSPTTSAPSSPTSPTGPTGPTGHTATDPADIPLPPSPTGGRPTLPPLSIPTKTSGGSADSPTAPTTPTAPTNPVTSPGGPSLGSGGGGESGTATVDPADIPLPPSPTT